MILALDNATRLGFAHGVVGGAPSWGSQDFGRGRSNGEVLSAFRAWLVAKIEATRPTLVCFESPYMPVGNNPFAAPANALTIRRLYAFAGITEAVCFERHLRCAEARPSEITKAFLGGPAPRGRQAKKAATVKMCRLLGFAVDDDDQADALALWCYAEAQFSPSMISHRRAAAGVELDLHRAQTTSAPRRLPRGAQVPSKAREQSDGFTNTQQDNFQFGELQPSD